MYKSDVDEIIQNMAALLEKRAGLFDWWKSKKFQKLDYNQFLQVVNSAKTCQEVPGLEQWDRTGFSDPDVDLGMRRLRMAIDKKRQELKCQ